MTDGGREPKRRRVDRRVLIVSIVLAAVVLALFLLFDFGYPTAPDTTSGGPDARFSAPPGPEETQPTTPENEP